MPLFPTPLPPSPGGISDAFLKNDVEIRIAEKLTETPNWFTGKKTMFGFALIGAGLIAGWMGYDLPQNQIRDVWTWLEANYEEIMKGVGLVIGVVGVIAKTVRHKKEVEVVKEVAKEAVVETLAAKAVVAEVKTELHAAKVEIAEIAKIIPPTDK